MASQEAVKNENNWEQAKNLALKAVKREYNFEKAQQSKNELYSCKEDIQYFLQHSGQCWSDSASVLLLFTPFIGKTIQNIFTKLPFETIIKQMGLWSDKEENVDFILGMAINTGYIRRNYPLFLHYLSNYLGCLYERFQSWHERQKEEDILPMRRQKSHAYSLCQEAAGKYAGFMIGLPDPNSKVPAYPEKEENIIYIKAKALQNKNIDKKFHFCEEAGFQPSIFSKCIAILLKFLYPTISIQQIYDLEKPIETFTFFYSILFEGISNISFHESIRIESISISSETHALCILRCPDGNEYLYDDNIGKLQKTKLISYFESEKNIDFHMKKYYYTPPIRNDSFIKHKSSLSAFDQERVDKIISSIHIFDEITFEVYNVNTQEKYNDEDFIKFLNTNIVPFTKVHEIKTIDYVFASPQVGILPKAPEGGKRLQRNRRRRTLHRSRKSSRVGSRRLRHHRK